ncbi:MAG TPA: ROK family transcriptional regulator [Halanaerobiales bacterium]|nr:ROK family transcriptional regulator [Halanaerobiales bacterium]
MDNIRIGSKNLIKNINKSLVINEIRQKGPISRTEISNKLKLGLSTVTKICEQLQNEDLIYEIGEGDSTGGRKPINLVFNNRYGYIIGIKIENQKVITSLTDLEPSILHKETSNFPRKASFDIVYDLVVAGIDRLLKKVKTQRGQVLGIGIAISGIINHLKGELVSSTLLGWRNIDFKNTLEQRYGINVYLDNDVNCYTLAQNGLGKGKDNNDFVCVTIGEGIGAGVIINNRLYRGFLGGAGEIGHMIINANGKECYCGQQGCLETCASEDFIVEYVKDKSGQGYDIEEIISRAYDNDQSCIEAISIAGRNIGYGLINVIMHYNPEKIILGGKGLKEKDFIVPHILETLNNNWFKRIGVETGLEIDDLGNKYFLLGASILVLSELLEIPIYKEQETLLDSMV